VRIREAGVDDMAAVCAIYNELIPTRTVAWTDELESLEQRVAWFHRQEADGMPVVVAVVDEIADGETADGEVVGFATYGEFRDNRKWPGYRFTVEHSIHVRDTHHGRGIGRSLLWALMDRARADGMHVMVAAVDAENVESLAFHERLGFREVGRLPQTGRKFDRWLDLVFLQIEL
jgi:L-amino acid N-acyltransferase YncA